MDQYSHHHRPPSKNGDITILEVTHSNYTQLKISNTALLSFKLDFEL